MSPCRLWSGWFHRRLLDVPPTIPLPDSPEVGVAGKSVFAVSGVALPEVILLVEGEIISRMG
jgi:hypothetical protein